MNQVYLAVLIFIQPKSRYPLIRIIVQNDQIRKQVQKPRTRTINFDQILSSIEKQSSPRISQSRTKTEICYVRARGHFSSLQRDKVRLYTLSSQFILNIYDHEL